MKNRKVSIWLGVGIALCPLIFSWFTLRKGHSRNSKIISFSWLILTGLLAAISPSENEANTNVIQSSNTPNNTNESLITSKDIESPQITEPAITIKNEDIKIPSKKDLSHLSDCEYSKKMLEETAPLLEKATSFVNDTDYHEIAQWRVNTFNAAISEVEQKYMLSPQEMMSKDRILSGSIHSDFVNRSKLLVQAIYDHIKNHGDKAAIQEQWQIIKKAGAEYAQQCEQINQPVKTVKKEEPKLLIKMSKSGICHSPSSSWYNRTKNYTAYSSMESCLANGGRRPNK